MHDDIFNLQNKNKEMIAYSISKFGISDSSGGRGPDKLLLSSNLEKQRVANWHQNSDVKIETGIKT